MIRRRPAGPTRAARFAAAAIALWAAHDLGDHVVQTDEQAAGKATTRPAGYWQIPMAGHLAGYHATQLVAIAALRPLGVRPPWWRAAAAVALSAGTHGLLDRRWPVIELLDLTGSQRFARPEVRVGSTVDGPHPIDGSTASTGPLPLHGPYLADQALHKLVLVVCAAVLAA